MGELSFWHWLVVLGAFVVLFGAARLPGAARNLGQSMRILKAELGATSESERAEGERAERPAVPGDPASGTGSGAGPGAADGGSPDRQR